MTWKATMDRWPLVVTLGWLAGCAEQPLDPGRPDADAQLAAAIAAPTQLATGGASATIFAKAISPRGWILGNWYWTSIRVRAQSWSPYPGLSVSTIQDTASVYSGTDGHGDVTAYVRDNQRYGPAVIFADAATGGQPYTVAYLPTRASDGPDNMSAYAINDDHVVVGWTVGSAALVWFPTGPRAWAEPIDLPRPFYPGGYDAFGSQAHGINNAGFIVGWVAENGNNGDLYHAILWRAEKAGEVWTDALVDELPKDPRATGHRAHDINDAGVIAGVVLTGRGEFPALWFPDAPGVYTRPPTVLSGTQDWDIGKLNRCGWLAFTSMGKSTTEAYVWDGTTAVLLPRLAGASGGRGYDVSDQGDVVGMARFTPKNRSSYGVAVLWRGAVPACP